MKYIADVATLAADTDKCTGCGLCLEVCPHAVLTLHNRKVAITDRDRCMECGACSMNCPFGALSVDKGVGCAVAFINSFITGGEPACGCSGEGSQQKNCC